MTSNQAKHGIPDNLRCFACKHVADNSRLVKLVFHQDDDAWIFTCAAPHPDIPSEYPVIGIGHVLGADPTLNAILDLPMGWQAERPGLGKPWDKTPIHE